MNVHLNPTYKNAMMEVLITHQLQSHTLCGIKQQQYNCKLQTYQLGSPNRMAE